MDQHDLVKFMQDDQDHRALYKKNGSPVYHIAYGYEKNLPAAIRHRIKSKYYDHEIIHVVHVQQKPGDFWVVKLQQNMEYIIAEVTGDNLIETDRFKSTAPAQSVLTNAKQ